MKLKEAVRPMRPLQGSVARNASRGIVSLRRTLACILFGAGVGVASAASASAGGDTHCAVGTYRLRDDSIVDIARADAAHWRWRRTDGTSGLLSRALKHGWTSTLGWTGKPDSHHISLTCRPHRLRFDGQTGTHVRLKVRNIHFEVEDAILAGRLVMPEGRAKVPIVVLIHGAEHDSALDSYPLQRLFPAAGIGAFVYDKRGTGTSGGQYTQDYPTLAADAVAALKEARSLAGKRAGRIGYQGGSQGGWVAPLAATMTQVDYVIVSFGLAVSPLAAERESIVREVRAHVSGPEGVRIANEFADAIERVASSNFRDGFDQLDALRQRYGGEPWFRRVGGEFARFLLDAPAGEVRKSGPPLIAGINLNYDPMPVLRSLHAPQLWLLGGRDRDAAPYQTARQLTQLRCAGRPITLLIYPNAEHGMYEFVAGPRGERLSTRQPRSYFRLMRDFISKGPTSTPQPSDVKIPACSSLPQTMDLRPAPFREP